MLKQSYLLIILCSFYLIACQNANNNEGRTGAVHLLKKEVIKIPLDSLSQAPVYNVQYLGDSLMLCLNKNINAIEYYDLNTARLVKRLPFPIESNEGVGKIGKFLWKAPDSIFLLNPPRYQVFLVNDRAKILRKYDLLKTKISSKTAMPDAMPLNQMYCLGQTLYLPALGDGNPTQPDFFENQPNLIALDLKSGNFHYHVKYPQIYRENFYAINRIYHSFTYLPWQKQFAFSFMVDKAIQVYQPDWELAGSFVANSQLFGEVEPLAKPVNDGFLSSQEGNKTPLFAKLYSDPQRKLLLRLASEAPHQQNGSANEEARVGLIVMNQNLTKIGEQVFEENPQHIAWLTLGVGKTYHYAALREGENLSEDTLYLQQFELRTELY